MYVGFLTYYSFVYGSYRKRRLAVDNIDSDSAAVTVAVVEDMRAGSLVAADSVFEVHESANAS